MARNGGDSLFSRGLILESSDGRSMAVRTGLAARPGSTKASTSCFEVIMGRAGFGDAPFVMVFKSEGKCVNGQGRRSDLRLLDYSDRGCWREVPAQLGVWSIHRVVDRPDALCGEMTG